MFKNISSSTQKYPIFLLDDNSYSIYDIYKIDENSETVETRKFAVWNPFQGLSIAEENIWKRRSNLKGHHLR